MTGPEHYREAERLILLATDEDRTPSREPQPDDWTRSLIDLAQVHATLASAAAQAATLADRYVGDGDHINAWQGVIA